MLIAITILGLGMIVLVPAMALVDASFRSVGRASERADELYSAEAAIETVVADLRQGADILDVGYTTPTLDVNGLSPYISIVPPPAAFPRIFVFADPGTSVEMAPLAPGASFEYVVHGVVADTKIEFNWNYTPGTPAGGQDTRIEVFEGISTDTVDRIKNNTDNSSPHTLTVGAGINDGGSFTFRFTNESGVSLTSAAFGDAGEPSLTWMSLMAGVDSIVTAESGDTTLQAYLQQGPGGASGSERTAAILGWVQPEDYFSDLQQSGSTAGWLLDTGGLSVDISDVADPVGFNIDVSGGGGGTAKVVACGSLLLLTDGDSVNATCGSLVLEVITGQVRVVVNSQVTINVPVTTQTEISKLPNGNILVANDPATPTSDPITADLVAADRSAVIGVPSAATVEIKLPPGGGIVIEQPPGSTGVTIDTGSGLKPVVPGEQVEVIPAPPAGLRGAKELAVEQLTPFIGDSSRFQDAIEAIEKSLTESWWVDEITLDSKKGKEVFKSEKKAVGKLQEAISGDDLSTVAEETASGVIVDLVAVDRDLALTALDLSIESPASNPANMGKIEREQAKAQEEMDKADAERGAGEFDKAVTHYSHAWERAQKALKLQIAFQASGLRQTKVDAITSLAPYQSESSRLEKAIENIADSLNQSWWLDDNSLDHKDGDEVFKAEKEAVDELQKAIDGDLTEGAHEVAEAAIDDLLTVDRSLAVGALNLSIGSNALDPENQDDLIDAQEDAQEELDKGDVERERGHAGKAIDHFLNAWQDAQAALEIQAKVPDDGDDGGKGKDKKNDGDDDDDDDDEGKGKRDDD